jgi:hypothetical protein
MSKNLNRTSNIKHRTSNLEYLKLKGMKFLLLFTTSLFISGTICAQDDLENILNSQVQEPIDYTTATFKATRIMNGQSVERMPQGQLDFRIHHRFGAINEGAYNFWGIDGATTHFSLEYGITDWIMVGIGRGVSGKTYDGFTKLSLYRQSTGRVEMPVSISWFSSVADQTIDYPVNNNEYPYSTRISYANQLLVARKFNNNFSFQISPSTVHYNMVATAIDPNDLFACGFGARYKLTNRLSVNAEYFYVYKPHAAYLTPQIYNPFSIGVDIETGGHVFQLIITNSQGMIEKDFIGRTTDKWSKAGIHFGFNISRVFDVNHHK